MPRYIKLFSPDLMCWHGTEHTVTGTGDRNRRQAPGSREASPGLPSPGLPSQARSSLPMSHVVDMVRQEPKPFSFLSTSTSYH